MLVAVARGQIEVAFFDEKGDFTVRLQVQAGAAFAVDLNQGRRHLIVRGTEQRQTASETRARRGRNDLPARTVGDLAEDLFGGIEAVRLVRQGHGDLAVGHDVINHVAGAEIGRLAKIRILLLQLLPGGVGGERKRADGQQSCESEGGTDGFHGMRVAWVVLYFIVLWSTGGVFRYRDTSTYKIYVNRLPRCQHQKINSPKSTSQTPQSTLSPTFLLPSPL